MCNRLEIHPLREIFLGTKELIRLILVSGGVVLVDQVTKYLITLNLKLHDHIVVIENFFNITCDIKYKLQ